MDVPSLKFTKAELLYIANILAKELPPTDNSTLLEMVELRHFFNQAKNAVAEAIGSGTLFIVGQGRADIPPKPKNAPETKEKPIPTITELRREFPTLTDKEIIEIIQQARAERKAEEERKKKEAESEKVVPPELSSFAEKPKEEERKPTGIVDEKRLKEIENAKKFETLLTSF